MGEFSMTNHSADPNQSYLSRIRKLIHFTVRIQKHAKNKGNSKKNIIFFQNGSASMLKLTTSEQIPILKVSTVRGSLKIRRGSGNSWRRSNYFIQNARIRSPALVQIMKRYQKNLEEWLLLLHTVRYFTKNVRIRIYSHGTLLKTRGSGFIVTVPVVRYGTVINLLVLKLNKR